MARRVGQTFLVTTALLVAWSPAQAQRPGFGFRSFTGLYLLEDSRVHQELKLDAGKAEKASRWAKEAIAKHNTDLKGINALIGIEPPQVVNQKRRDLRVSLTSRSEEFLQEFLTPDQLKRYNQIYYQSFGVRVFDDPEVIARLNLNADQSRRVENELATVMQRARDVSRKNPDHGEKWEEAVKLLSQEATHRITEAFNEQQKGRWTELIGKPCPFAYEKRGP
jgi:hypothetical protein